MIRRLWQALVIGAACVVAGASYAQDAAELPEPSAEPVSGANSADPARVTEDSGTTGDTEPVLPQTAEPVTAPSTRMTLDTTQVTGNRELPKVLVIVPWKNPELVELTGRPLASLVEEALSPIDPAVFRRQVDYYNALQDDADKGDN